MLVISKVQVHQEDSKACEHKKVLSLDLKALTERAGLTAREECCSNRKEGTSKWFSTAGISPRCGETVGTEQRAAGVPRFCSYAYCVNHLRSLFSSLPFGSFFSWMNSSVSSAVNSTSKNLHQPFLVRLAMQVSSMCLTWQVNCRSISAR